MRPYLRVQNVFLDRIDTSDVMSMNFSDPEFETYRLVYGDILLNEGQSLHLVGRPAMFRNEIEGACFTNTLVRFQAGSAILGEFALQLFIYCLQTGRFQQIAKWTTNIAHLGAGRFASLEVPVPPLNEQRRIVDKVETLNAKSRRAKAALDTIPPLLEKFRQSILAAAFRGDLTADWRAKNPNVEPASKLLERIRTERRQRWEAAELEKLRAKGKAPADDRWKAKYEEPAAVDTEGLPELPEGWAWGKASDIVDPDADIVYGIVQPGPPLSDGVPYVRGKDIQDGEILIDQLWRTSEKIAAEYSRSKIRSGDVLLCIIRHLKVAVVPSELDGGNLSRTTARVRPATGIQTDFLAQALRSPWCQTWLKSRYRGGTSMPKVNIADACELPIPIAPPLEQAQVCLAIENSLRCLKNAQEAFASSMRQLAAVDPAILAKAFRGELVPQDPNDEPASVLLERIRAEREVQSSIETSKRKGKKRALKPEAAE